MEDRWFRLGDHGRYPARDSFRTMNDIQTCFQSLIALFPSDSISLRDAIQEQDEDELVMALDSAPEELLEILAICDGQEPVARMPLFPFSLRLLSAKEVASYYEGFFKHGDSDGGAMKLTNRDQVIEFNDARVKNDRWWQRGWVPFAGRISWLLIDLSPAENGQIGQIVHWHQDDGFGNVVAHSLQQLILDMTTTVDCGKKALSLERAPNAG